MIIQFQEDKSEFLTPTSESGSFEWGPMDMKDTDAGELYPVIDIQSNVKWNDDDDVTGDSLCDNIQCVVEESSVIQNGRVDSTAISQVVTGGISDNLTSHDKGNIFGDLINNIKEEPCGDVKDDISHLTTALTEHVLVAKIQLSKKQKRGRKKRKSPGDNLTCDIDKGHGDGRHSNTDKKELDIKSVRRQVKSKAPHTCCVCDRQFSKVSNLYSHQRTHCGIKPYTCPTCNKAFGRKSNLTEHSRIHTGERPYKCEVCVATFASSRTLANHSRIHTGVKPYRCDLCDRAFTCSGQLTHHVRTHTGQRPYGCDLCPKTFSRSDELSVHRRVHTGETPYRCPHCDKSFKQVGHLTRHVRVHRDDRRYVCPDCGKAFVTASDLRTHRRVHTGERPYVCQVCNRAFSQSGGMTAHMKTHIRQQQPFSTHKIKRCRGVCKKTEPE